MLPYRDTKPKGAADFYLAINATFRFIHHRLGEQGWSAWLHDLATRYFRPVTDVWAREGLPAVAAYWRAFFSAEPGGDVVVTEAPGCVTLEVRTCPAIAYLKASQREIVPFYCQHCFHLGNARAGHAGLSFQLEGGNGACHHTYREGSPPAPQSIDSINTVTP